MPTLNYLDEIYLFGGYNGPKVEAQVGFWHTLLWLAPTVRVAWGIQAYFNISLSKTALGKLLRQEEERKRHDIL